MHRETFRLAERLLRRETVERVDERGRCWRASVDALASEPGNYARVDERMP